MRPSDEMAARLGSAAAGSMVGMLLGLFAGICMFAVLTASPSLPAFVFGGAALGFILGLSFPVTARGMIAATVHFVIGLFTAATYGEVKPDQNARPSLKFVFWAGVLCGLVMLFLSLG